MVKNNIMFFLHSFNNKADHDIVYGGDTYREPWAAKIVKNNVVTYNKIHGDIVGSIIYVKNNGKIKATSPEIWNSSLGTPIAIVAVPASHTSDGKCRGVSLVNMSCITPQIGTVVTGNTQAQNAGATLMYGRTQNIIGIKDYDKIEYLNDIAVGDAWLPSDKYNGGYYSGSNGPTESSKSVSPFTSDGEKNPKYHTPGQVLSDMDGKMHTHQIVNLSSIKDTYKGGSFQNSDSNYPAAFACWLYNTQGTSQGDWYLPSMGELGYMFCMHKTINNSIFKLGSIAVRLLDWPDYGQWNWSSSESTNGAAWGINNQGKVSKVTKTRTSNTYRVRAFCAFEL